MFSMMSAAALPLLGRQDVIKSEINKRFKKHRAERFPLCSPVTDKIRFIPGYSSFSRKITASDWPYKSAVITLSPFTSFPWYGLSPA